MCVILKMFFIQAQALQLRPPPSFPTYSLLPLPLQYHSSITASSSLSSCNVWSVFFLSLSWRALMHRKANFRSAFRPIGMNLPHPTNPALSPMHVSQRPPRDKQQGRGIVSRVARSEGVGWRFSGALSLVAPWLQGHKGCSAVPGTAATSP